MVYEVRLKRSAERAFKGLSQPLQRRIKPKIDALAENPRPSGVKKLPEPKDTYRIRVGDYRVVYEVRDDVLVVLVIRVRHRRDVYRGL